jgi:hypothetical protein
MAQSDDDTNVMPMHITLGLPVRHRCHLQPRIMNMADYDVNSFAMPGVRFRWSPIPMSDSDCPAAIPRYPFLRQGHDTRARHSGHD